MYYFLMILDVLTLMIQGYVQKKTRKEQSQTSIVVSCYQILVLLRPVEILKQ